VNVLLFISAARAATFVVNTVDDTHDDTWGDLICADASYQCSLRAAIEEANAWPGADVIDLTAVSGFFYLGNTGDSSIDDEPLTITESVTISGDADYVNRTCSYPGYYVDCEVFVIDAGGTADVVFESFGIGADPARPWQATYGLYIADGSNVTLDQVDLVDLWAGVDGVGASLTVRGGLFWGNQFAVDTQLAIIEDSFFYQNRFGVYNPTRVYGTDFVENSVGVTTNIGTVANSTFVDNDLGLKSYLPCSDTSCTGPTVLTSSFSGNVRHWEGPGQVVQVTFGPNDPGTCEAPVVVDTYTWATGLILRATNSIFTAPACGTAPACSGTLSVPAGYTSLVENIGDLVYPDCELVGTGTWLYGVDGFTLDPGLDALESHRTFTSDLFGSIDGGEAHPLLSSSPAVDAGGRPLRRPDLAGNLFIYDGNGDALRARDLGALEYVP